MFDVLMSMLVGLKSTLRARASLQVEILAPRHQLAVLQRGNRRRLRLRTSDRVLWVVLSRLWPEWRKFLLLVKPDTVIAWHRKGFQLYWKWKSRRRRLGRPGDSEGDPGADPQHERFECSLGSTEAAWGTAQARNRGVPGNGFEVHDKASEAAFTNVADVSGESYHAICVTRLLRGADREFPDPVRVPRSGS